MKSVLRMSLLLAAVLSTPVSAAGGGATAKRPNFLIIVADDLGYSDLGAFGGEIETPNLDRLAMQGIRFTSFYTAPTCSPTRAMLLTGQDAHKVGLGTMAEMLPMAPQLAGKPGYEGFLDPGVVTLAETLAEGGYRTMMTGKWHLGIRPEHHPAAHGFQKSYALLQGAGDHFGEDQGDDWGEARALYSEDGKFVRFPVGRYTGDFFTERLIEYMRPSKGEDRPFLAYLAFNEPHWPLQAPAELIAKYRGRYDAGPKALRADRLAKMAKLGLLPPAGAAAPLADLGEWDRMTPEQRALAARAMEVYAAMVESIDINVGRVLAALENSGQLDNTVILFMSDNGAEGTSQQQMNGLLKMFRLPPDKIQSIAEANTDPTRAGGVGSYVAYGPEWAQAAMAPFRHYKGVTNEGGIRAPAFVAGTGVRGGRIVGSALSVRDVMPTLLDLAGVARKQAATAAPASEALPSGKSWASLLAGKNAGPHSENDVMAWELFFRRGVRIGTWKAVFDDGNPDLLSAPRSGGWAWRLYDLASDPGESADLAQKRPEVLARLKDAWFRYARENGVVVPSGIAD